jgi:hypothetical protein
MSTQETTPDTGLDTLPPRQATPHAAAGPRQPGRAPSDADVASDDPVVAFPPPEAASDGTGEVGPGHGDDDDDDDKDGGGGGNIDPDDDEGFEDEDDDEDDEEPLRCARPRRGAGRLGRIDARCSGGARGDAPPQPPWDSIHVRANRSLRRSIPW